MIKKHMKKYGLILGILFLPEIVTAQMLPMAEVADLAMVKTADNLGAYAAKQYSAHELMNQAATWSLVATSKGPKIAIEKDIDECHATVFATSEGMVTITLKDTCGTIAGYNIPPQETLDTFKKVAGNLIVSCEKLSCTLDMTRKK